MTKGFSVTYHIWYRYCRSFRWVIRVVSIHTKSPIGCKIMLDHNLPKSWSCRIYTEWDFVFPVCNINPITCTKFNEVSTSCDMIKQTCPLSLLSLIGRLPLSSHISHPSSFCTFVLASYYAIFNTQELQDTVLTASWTVWVDWKGNLCWFW